MKIKNEIRKLKNLCITAYRVDFVFGIRQIFNNLLYLLLRIIARNQHSRTYTVNRIHNETRKFINKHFSDILTKYNNLNIYDTVNLNSKYPNTVWIFWNDTKNLPDLVVKCRNNIQKHIPKEFTIKYVSPNNIKEYIPDLPIFIIDKYKKGLISDTHFSDIVRVNLLRLYGGLWMDATMFFSENIKKDILTKDFYTIKIQVKEISGVIANGRWCVFFMYCKYPNNLLMIVLSELFSAYWKKFNYLYDYFWLDNFLDSCIENIPSIKSMIENVPYNNQHTLSIDFSMPYNESLCFPPYNDTYIYKISAKKIMNTSEYNKNNMKTIKWYLLNKWLE